MKFFFQGELSAQDEDDVLQELDQLVAAEEDNIVLPEVPTENVILPEVPTEEPSTEKTRVKEKQKVAMEAAQHYFCLQFGNE